MLPMSPPLRSRSAFTLLEVLVTCAVLGLLLAILLSIFSASLTLWRDTDSKIYADREARAARLQISQDLSNAILPSNSTTTLWPQVTTQGNAVYLQFLTKADANYQTEEGDSGDICFVEYAINSDSKTLTRRFLGSQRTYNDILLTGRFPSPGSGPNEEAQMLASNLLPENAYAIRGLENLEGEMSNRKFILLTGANLLPNPVTDINPPRAIEVNFAVTDPDSATDESIQLLESDPDYVLKDGGLYSFRVFLPPPAESNPAP
jgi:prepilin-type N-terminal cleavage/methylation domain-containing protein